MSIPKIIHYCWFGGGPISPESRKCIESWKKYCPDYKIIEWNEQNFEISQNRYAQQAYEAKKYAFVSDYVRLAVLYRYGGIYLDTDVELVRPRQSGDGHQRSTDQLMLCRGWPMPFAGRPIHPQSQVEPGFSIVCLGAC